MNGQSNTSGKSLGFKIALIVVLVVFLIMAIVIFTAENEDINSMNEDCTQPVTGTITKVSSYESEERDEYHEDRYVMVTYYSPVVEYTVDGETYTFNGCEDSTNLSRYKVGASITLMCNPQNPSQCYEPTSMTGRSNDMIKGIVFTVVIVIGLIVCLIRFLIKRSRNYQY